MKSVRIQVLVEPEERVRMGAQAEREGKSLSEWLRDAGTSRLVAAAPPTLDSPEALSAFFAERDGVQSPDREPDWEEHLAAIEASRRDGLPDSA